MNQFPNDREQSIARLIRIVRVYIESNGYSVEEAIDTLSWSVMDDSYLSSVAWYFDPANTEGYYA